MTRGSSANAIHGREAAARRFLARYLEEAPVGVAVFRAAEAVAFSTAGPLARPVLDVGCGFGEFGRIFFEGSALPEVGLDLDRSELMRERLQRAYGSVTQADVRRLPLADASFGTVMSVSTLEHVPGVSAAFPELARVLRPGGRLIFTVPIEQLNEHLVGYRALRVAGPTLAQRYATALHAALTHVNVWAADHWIDLVRDSGLEVTHTERALSHRATMAFEALLPAAYANRVWRRLTGKRPPHPAPMRRIAERILLPLLLEDDPRGSNLFLVAAKR